MKVRVEHETPSPLPRPIGALLIPVGLGSWADEMDEIPLPCKRSNSFVVCAPADCL